MKYTIATRNMECHENIFHIIVYYDVLCRKRYIEVYFLLELMIAVSLYFQRPNCVSFYYSTQPNLPSIDLILDDYEEIFPIHDAFSSYTLTLLGY